MTRTALFAGSFNPFTIGHADIVERALEIFDRVIIAIGYNEMKPMPADLRPRLMHLQKLYSENNRVTVISYGGLTANFAKQEGVTALIRGVRNSADFEYEKNLADINRELLGIDTIFLPCRPQLAYISSSAVRELSHNGFDTSSLLPTAER